MHHHDHHDGHDDDHHDHPDHRGDSVHHLDHREPPGAPGNAAPRETGSRILAAWVSMCSCGFEGQGTQLSPRAMVDNRLSGDTLLGESRQQKKRTADSVVSLRPRIHLAHTLWEHLLRCVKVYSVIF